MTDMLVEYRKINVTTPVNCLIPEKRKKRGKHTD